MEAQPIINQPIETLGFSPEFVEASGAMGFKTIADVVAAGPENLLKKEGFTYHWLAELATFLSGHKLLHLLQPVPGKSYN